MAPVIKLNSGYDMPQVGFGLWKVDNAVASDVVYNAIKAGYRLFDGACGKSHLPAPHLPVSPFHRPAGNGCAGFTMTLEHALLNVEGETTPPPPSFSTPHANGGVEFCRTLAGSASGTGGGPVWNCAKGRSHLHITQHTEESETAADPIINRLRQRG
jgi:hypothetical protein